MKDKIIEKQREIIKIQDKIINHYFNRTEMYLEEFSKKLDKLETICLKLESDLAALEAEIANLNKL